jgi:hypothetical protein
MYAVISRAAIKSKWKSQYFGVRFMISSCDRPLWTQIDCALQIWAHVYSPASERIQDFFMHPSLNNWNLLSAEVHDPFPPLTAVDRCYSPPLAVDSCDACPDFDSRDTQNRKGHCSHRHAPDMTQELDAAILWLRARARVQIHDTPRHICEYGVDMDAD